MSSAFPFLSSSHSLTLLINANQEGERENWEVQANLQMILSLFRLYYFQSYFVLVKQWKEGLSPNCVNFERINPVSADSRLNCQPFNRYLVRIYQLFSSQISTLAKCLYFLENRIHNAWLTPEPRVYVFSLKHSAKPSFPPLLFLPPSFSLFYFF